MTRRKRLGWYFIHVPMAGSGWGYSDHSCERCPECGGPTVLSIGIPEVQGVEPGVLDSMLLNTCDEPEYHGETGCDTCSVGGICDHFSIDAHGVAELLRRTDVSVSERAT